MPWLKGATDQEVEKVIPSIRTTIYISDHKAIPNISSSTCMNVVVADFFRYFVGWSMEKAVKYDQSTVFAWLY